MAGKSILGERKNPPKGKRSVTFLLQGNSG